MAPLTERRAIGLAVFLIGLAVRWIGLAVCWIVFAVRRIVFAVRVVRLAVRVVGLAERRIAFAAVGLAFVVGLSGVRRFAERRTCARRRALCNRCPDRGGAYQQDTACDESMFPHDLLRVCVMERSRLPPSDPRDVNGRAG